MMGQQKITLHQSILTGMGALDQPSGADSKAHDYTHRQSDVDYVIEPAELPNQYYMTGQGKGVRLGDRILLRHSQTTQAYAVRKIDYYADPAEMWIALLDKQCE